MSTASLTGYDNNFEGSGECGLNAIGSTACLEVFEYEAESNTLSCASCNPSGERPLGQSNLSLIRADGPPFRQPGNLSVQGEGRLFFESQDALSPNDTNGHIQDVYEWEPQGVGSCERPGGCVYLISSGHSANDSMFVDSSADGKDAFFVTREQLVNADRNDQLDLYDARAPHVPGEAVGFSEAAGALCGGEACRGPLPGAPALPSAGSREFNGPGNPPRKHKKKKHKKHQRHHHKRAAKHNRGGAR